LHIYQNIVNSSTIITKVKAKNKNNDDQEDEIYHRKVYKAIRAMREKIAPGSDYLKNINERPCIERFDKCLKSF